MAKTTIVRSVSYHANSKKRKPGVHSKSKTSRHKNSKHYVKPYRGQGK